MRVTYLGPEGSFSEEAARAFRPDATLLPCASIAGTLTALIDGQAERAFVPLDNIKAGPVGETLDALFALRDEILICDIQVQRVRHAVGALGQRHEIQTIRSHATTLAQCTDYLSRHFPNALRESLPSSSRAVSDLAQSRDEHVAVVGNPNAMTRYSVPILDRDIGDASDNTTRFALISRRADGTRVPSGRDVTTIVLSPPADRTGVLLDALTIVSGRHQINLSAMHSRPNGRGGLRFFVDIEGHMDDDEVHACVAELTSRLTGDRVDVAVLGSYPRRAFVTPCIRTIGIIGGTGAMGRWLHEFFSSAGYDVLVSGRDTDLTYDECIAHANAVVVNVPIQHTRAVIEKVAPLMASGQVLVDNTSIKRDAVKAMLEHAPEGVEVLGMHTVFGPAAAGLKGQNVIFTRTDRAGRRSAEFENIFYKHGAQVTYADSDAHDRQMALHQNLEHFTKLVLAEVITQTVPDADALEPFSSPNSRASLATMGRVLHMDLELLGQIQSHNQYGAAVIRQYADVVERLACAVEQGDLAALQRSVEKSAGQLGHRFLSDMLARSKRLDQVAATSDNIEV
ncbi:MAG: prephenate dehydrogenase/arogenate dehydrogenase family protein [Pseudomonadota bacterium]